MEQRITDAAAAPSDAGGGPVSPGAPAGADPADDAPIHAPGYHAPPPPPRDEMWARIEASWALRRPAGPASGGARAAPGRRPAWTSRRIAGGWVAALAAAASLVLGVALGRGTRTAQTGQTLPPPAPPSRAADLADAATPPVDASLHLAAVAALDLPITVAEQPSDPEGPSASAAESASTIAAATEPADVPEGGNAATGAQRPLPAAVRRSRPEPEHDYVTARHLGRAATLLTAFRTDRRTPASEQDLAQWARELLVDTRMFLGLSDFGSPIEQALLEDLELVLIQIAGLGPDAPDFEWTLARESMERRATLTRLRAASAEAET